MSTHTPGPWHVGLKPGPIVYGSKGEQVADCRFENGDDNKANACLIAAAPELRDALADLFEQCAMVHKHWGDGNNSKESDAAIERGRALLARIDGLEE